MIELLKAMSELMIDKRAGVGQGREVARRSWLRTLAEIRGLPEREPGHR